MNILVVNDDGINAYGIELLAKSLREFGNVYVVAPDRPRSAASHSVVLHRPLTFEEVDKIPGVKCFQTSGVPCDCVRLGSGILDVKFDVVFSGINNGLNLGTDIIYSGTCAGAREAVIEGIPGVAISTDFDQFTICENEIASVLKKIFENKLYSRDYLLNINFPVKGYDKSIGSRVCRMGNKIFSANFTKQADGSYMDSSKEIIHDKDMSTDVALADLGYITYVPVKIDSTCYEAINKIKL